MAVTNTLLTDGTVIKNKLSGELAEVVHPSNQLMTHFVYENGADDECLTCDLSNLFDVADSVTAAQFVSSFDSQTS